MSTFWCHGNHNIATPCYGSFSDRLKMAPTSHPVLQTLHALIRGKSGEDAAKVYPPIRRQRLSYTRLGVAAAIDLLQTRKLLGLPAIAHLFGCVSHIFCCVSRKQHGAPGTHHAGGAQLPGGQSFRNLPTLRQAVVPVP